MKTTIKSIQAKYPDFSIVGKSKDYHILHKPTNSWNACILRNCDLDSIEQLIASQQQKLDEGDGFDYSYFRIPETQSVSLTDNEVNKIFSLIGEDMRNEKNPYHQKMLEVLQYKFYRGN